MPPYAYNSANVLGENGDAVAAGASDMSPGSSYSGMASSDGASAMGSATPYTAAIMAAVSGIKAATTDKQRADAARKYQAVTALWSPWTHMASHDVAAPDIAGQTISGGLAGWSLGQNMNNQATQGALNQARINNLNNGGSGGFGGGN